MTQWWGGVRVGGEQLSAAKTPSPEQCCTLFAVGLGSFDFRRQSSGIVAVYSLKNPSCPDYVYQTESGVMSVDFNTTTLTALLACGLYDGSICVFDLGKKDEKTMGYDRE
eukprot:COSAG04_NODE_23318_length_340_cov_1.066390_1_plen_109_part_10